MTIAERIAASHIMILPPDLFLLARLCPVLALTCQPVSDLPSKIDTKPVSLVCAEAENSTAIQRRVREQVFIVMEQVLGILWPSEEEKWHGNAYGEAHDVHMLIVFDREAFGTE